MTKQDTLTDEKARYVEHVQRFRAIVFVAGHLELVREFVHDDVIDHFAPANEGAGAEGFMSRFAAAQGAIKGLSIDVLLSAYDDGVLIQTILMNLQHTGDFMGIPATGKKFSIGGFDAFRFRDGKISEHWGVYDVSKIPDLLGMGNGWSSMWPKGDQLGAQLIHTQ